MKLQVKFKQHIITFQTFWLKTGGGGGGERGTYSRGSAYWKEGT